MKSEQSSVKGGIGQHIAEGSRRKRVRAKPCPHMSCYALWLTAQMWHDGMQNEKKEAKVLGIKTKCVILQPNVSCCVIIRER